MRTALATQRRLLPRRRRPLCAELLTLAAHFFPLRFLARRTASTYTAMSAQDKFRYYISQIDKEVC